jgi:Xaa-Pro aminopeptidase
MKSILLFITLLTFSATIIPVHINAADVDKKEPKKAIKVAPAAPNFSDAERQAELAARRQRVGQEMVDNSMLILMSADSKIYANDVDFYYRQENNLYYLTGLRQNGITLIMTKNNGEVRETLFLQKRNARFETWNGRMYSNEDATRISGITNIVDAKEAGKVLTAVRLKLKFTSEDGNFAMINPPDIVYLVQGNRKEYEKETEMAKEIDEKYQVRNASPIFAKLRQIKSPYEIRMMQHSVDITSEALMRSMGMIGRANFEYEVQAEVEYTFRRRNADYWGYPSIVGCGPNATTLHYVTSQGAIKKGDLMLMDVGAEYDYYTADVTRTFPVNGKFTKEQAEIYQIVYDAQEAAARELKPGSTFGAASTAALEVVKERLFKLGLITDKNSNQYRLWYLHGLGHWLGMNVHDVGNYNVPLKEGMIMTNEPGIYFREDALDYLPDTPEYNEFKKKVQPVFEKYKNIGVRIEDDLLITKDGVEWMTKDLPRTIEDVESFMSLAKKEMDRYAMRETSPTTNYAMINLNKKPFDLNKKIGFDYDFRVLSGNTMRGGWVTSTKTHEIHSH